MTRSKTMAAVREMEQDRDASWRRIGLALAYHALGRKKEGQAALAELIEKGHAVWAFQIAQVYAFRGETNQAFEWLERAYAQRDPGLVETNSEPLFERLRANPRYKAFLEKLRFPISAPSSESASGPGS